MTERVFFFLHLLKGKKGSCDIYIHASQEVVVSVVCCTVVTYPLIIQCCFLLQANLPLLQRELLHCARLAKQNPAQYLAQHEQLLLDTSTTSPVDSSELLLDVNENGKRRTPDRWVNPNIKAAETFPLYYLISCMNLFESACIPVNPYMAPQTQAEPIQGKSVMC